MENFEIVGYDYLAEKQEKQKNNEGREKKDEKQKKDGQNGDEGTDEKKKTGENEDKDEDKDEDDGGDEGGEKEEGAEIEEQENAEEEEINEEEFSLSNVYAASQVSFPTDYWHLPVLYNRSRMIEEVTSMESSDRGFYENLPNFETEEELHRAIYMRQFTMRRLDHDIQVTNRYAQWLSTRVENGERVRNTLEDDIWEIPNWVSEYSGSEDEEE